MEVFFYVMLLFEWMLEVFVMLVRWVVGDLGVVGKVMKSIFSEFKKIR